MKHCYINGIGCVSAQDTLDYTTFLETAKELKENIVGVHKPVYRDFIKPAMIRRMAMGVKNGVVASSIALKDANIKEPDAIITGTGMGCMVDSEKFLRNIIDNDEQFLTPTAFIQSTHNTVGGQIALGLKCKAYNVTYVHGATSFESSLLDALLMINDGEENILVGGVDENGAHTVNMFKLIHHVKQEETFKVNVLETKTDGAVFSEGAQFFNLGNQKTTNSYAELLDVAIFDSINEGEVPQKLNQFLKENNLSINDIDLVVLGNNGDVNHDKIYHKLQETLLKDIAQVYYKHYSGEYNTVSAFGLWIASNICKTQKIPDILKLNTKEVSSIKQVLLYNQYRGENHSFTLIKSC
jgi:3-oxoacyl-(acyl-carrier-protein) synthase